MVGRNVIPCDSDYQQYSAFINDQMQYQINPIKSSKMISDAYTETHENRRKTNTSWIPQKPGRPSKSVGCVRPKLNKPIKPSLLEKRYALGSDFFKISKGFQKLFTKDNDQKMRIPIAGYGGHVPHYNSGNMHGKSYRKLNMMSRLMERCNNKRDL